MEGGGCLAGSLGLPWAVRLRAAWKYDLYFDVVMVCEMRAEGTETGLCMGTHKARQTKAAGDAE